MIYSMEASRKDLTVCFRFAGTDYVGFNNSLSLALKDHSNRLYAIGHYLKTNKCLNKDAPVSLM